MKRRHVRTIAALSAACLWPALGDGAHGTARTRRIAAAVPRARGYLTTPEELARVKAVADRGHAPYAAAVAAQLAYATAHCGLSYEVPRESLWGTSRSTTEPKWMTEMSTVAYGCALAYHLSGDTALARSTRSFLQQVQACRNLNADHAGQARLNVSIHVPKFVYAADLLEGWSGWSSDDRRAFQGWIAHVAYPVTRSGLDGHHSANWAAWQQAAALAFSDYLWDRPDLRLSDETALSSPLSPSQAYAMARQDFLDSANGTNRSGSQNGCNYQILGPDDLLKRNMIRPDGGVPDELRRGGPENHQACDSVSLTSASNSGNASVNYMGFHRDARMVACEIAYRRGDPALFTNIARDEVRSATPETGAIVALPRGRGSPRELLTFVITNADRGGPVVRLDDGHRGSLEIHLRRYAGKPMPRFVNWRIEGGRFVGGEFRDEAWPQIYVDRVMTQLESLRPIGGSWVPFTTLTHADPLNKIGAPPTVAAPWPQAEPKK